jgi:hypothetical protein
MLNTFYIDFLKVLKIKIYLAYICIKVISIKPTLKEAVDSKLVQFIIIYLTFSLLRFIYFSNHLSKRSSLTKIMLIDLKTFFNCSMFV